MRCDKCSATRDVGPDVRTRLVRVAQAPSLSDEDATPWSSVAVAAYREIIGARLAEGVCLTCRAGLGAARLKKVMNGLTLPEFRFDDAAAAKIIAWTQQLSVECTECGTSAEI